MEQGTLCSEQTYVVIGLDGEGMEEEELVYDEDELQSLKKIDSKFSGSDVDTESGYVVSCLDGSRQVATECQNFSPKPSSEEEEEG